LKILSLLLFIFAALFLMGCTVKDDDDDDNRIIPIEEGNYGIYGTPGEDYADTLQYEQYLGTGPDSLDAWFWIMWTDYKGDPPVAIAKNTHEGYRMYWIGWDVEDRNLYDLMGRRTNDPGLAVNLMLKRDEVPDYILYKYPIQIDEEWLIFVDQYTNEYGDYICEYYCKGRYDLSTEIQVEAGDFSVIRYQYFTEGPAEYPILNSDINRAYCKPGTGLILNESYYDTTEPIIWVRIEELLDYHVH
jgi:hypothetical protein